MPPRVPHGRAGMACQPDVDQAGETMHPAGYGAARTRSRRSRGCAAAMVSRSTTRTLELRGADLLHASPFRPLPRPRAPRLPPTAGGPRLPGHPELRHPEHRTIAVLPSPLRAQRPPRHCPAGPPHASTAPGRDRDTPQTGRRPRHRLHRVPRARTPTGLRHPRAPPSLWPIAASTSAGAWTSMPTSTATGPAGSTSTSTPAESPASVRSTPSRSTNAAASPAPSSRPSARNAPVF